MAGNDVIECLSAERAYTDGVAGVVNSLRPVSPDRRERVRSAGRGSPRVLAIVGLLARGLIAVLPGTALRVRGRTAVGLPFDTYSRLLPAMHQQAAVAMDAILAGRPIGIASGC